VKDANGRHKCDRLRIGLTIGQWLGRARARARAGPGIHSPPRNVVFDGFMGPPIPEPGIRGEAGFLCVTQLSVIEGLGNHRRRGYLGYLGVYHHSTLSVCTVEYCLDLSRN